VADHTRIADLERLLEADPSSIAFAQLGEEYRRTGQLEAAVRVCRAGLARYPSHHSARITLARALLAQGRSDEARVELDAVARAAPDNVAVKAALDGWHRASAASNAGGDDQRVLNELEAWLAAIRADRARRSRPDPVPNSPLRR
jgi:predicted Zn-dependent protease